MTGVGDGAGRRAAWAFVACLGVSACHSGEGTRPADMSRAEHEAAAARTEQQADAHQARYDPDALQPVESGCYMFCFEDNPTEAHLAEARRLRRIAALHREASAKLRAAEQRACAGIPERHRDISPFFHAADITGVELDDDGPFVVHFAAIPSTSPAQFRALVECHLARNAALGWDDEGMEYCPLAVPHVSAVVTESSAGIDVALDVEDEAARRELEARVRRVGEPDPRDG